MNYQKAMKLAIQEALTAKSKGEDPFGAVLVDQKNEICYSTHSRCIELCDPTAHAEILLIREYCKKTSNIYLKDHTIVCSAEPCVMCSGAIKWAKIAQIVFSTPQYFLQTISGGKPKPSCESIVNTGNCKMKVIPEYMFEEGKEVFRDYSFKPKDRKSGI